MGRPVGRGRVLADRFGRWLWSRRALHKPMLPVPPVPPLTSPPVVISSARDPRHRARMSLPPAQQATGGSAECQFGYAGEVVRPVPQARQNSTRDPRMGPPDEPATHGSLREAEETRSRGPACRSGSFLGCDASPSLRSRRCSRRPVCRVFPGLGFHESRALLTPRPRNRLPPLWPTRCRLGPPPTHRSSSPPPSASGSRPGCPPTHWRSACDIRVSSLWQ